MYKDAINTQDAYAINQYNACCRYLDIPVSFDAEGETLLEKIVLLTEQRDELRKANEIISGREAEWIAKAHYDLDCMKEQRDRLADVLELFLNRVKYTSAFMDGELRGGKFDYRSSGFDAEVKQAYQTIAAVKGGNGD